MSVFGRILDKLGMKKKSPGATGTGQMNTGAQQGGSGAPGRAGSQTQSQGQQTQGQQSTHAQQAQPSQQRGAAAGAQMPPPQMPMSDVDIASKLDRMAAENPQKLNWRTSIVDLMKLLGMESSLAERKELATELGYPQAGMDDTAKMNIWLHKAVLWEIAKNGGNVPKELLD